MKRQLLVWVSCCVSTATFADAPQEAAAKIDAALMREYMVFQRQVRHPSDPRLPVLPPAADDASFLRRACIDLAGRLPRADEVRAFLASTAASKRAALTDALVKEGGAAEVRFRMLAEAFRVKDDDAVIAWLRQAAADDRPYDQIVTYLVGEGHLSRRDEGNALRTSTEVALAVLGEDLHCAFCHDHPYNDHTQMEAYQFAACFTTDDVFDTLRLPTDYRYPDGKPGDLVKPRVLKLVREAPPPMKRGKNLRKQVARWITADNTERLATVAGLRIWSGMFGMPETYVDHTVGGVDPALSWHDVHDKPILNTISSNCFGAPNLRAADRNCITWIDENFTQGSQQNAVTVLAAEFRRSGFRIGEFQRILARTEAYGRAGVSIGLAWSGSYLVPAPQIRRLPAEVIWDTLCMEKSEQLAQVPPLEHPLRMLGRGTREWSDESTTPLSHELVRFMMNSAEMEDAVGAEPAGRTTEELFMALLGRYPNGMEKAIAQQHRNESPQTAVQDIAWALLNTKEFMFRP
ncbi:DUF1549 domain-containing protein [Prosthecobacter sp.]|uniref:DUF1549 domain-containing protein n=1 Tax=Prosthecobacter sp. TaxID=1965333 RepID=UPI0037852485